MRRSIEAGLIGLTLLGCGFIAGYFSGWAKGHMPADRSQVAAQAVVKHPTQTLGEPEPVQSAASSQSEINQPLQPTPAPTQDAQPTAKPAPKPGTRPTPANDAAIVFEKVSYNFGRVHEGQTVRKVFTFSNRGKKELLIRRVWVACNCTTALPSTTKIPPGGKGQIDVVVQTAGFKDDISKEVYIESNDPKQPKVTLKMVGFVQRDIAVEPAYVYFTKLTPNAAATQTVRLIPNKGVAFNVTKLTADSPRLQLSEVRMLAKGGYEFDVTVGPEPQPDQLAANILVETDFVWLPQIRLQVVGNVTRMASREASGR